MRSTERDYPLAFNRGPKGFDMLERCVQLQLNACVGAVPGCAANLRAIVEGGLNSVSSATIFWLTIHNPKPMKRYWLLFSQSVTLLLAAYFVVATLKPHWLRSNPPALNAPAAAAPGLPAPANAPGAVAPAGSFRYAAQKASAAVVSINTTKAQRGRTGNQQEQWFRFFFGERDAQQGPQEGLGSGVIVSAQGYVLTNNHVIEGADDIEVVLSDGRRTKAKVIGTDPETDLALLKIELDKLPVIVFGNSDSLQTGDPVLAIGNPFGVGQTATGGIVSALGRNQLGINTFENFIQTDAAINPGNSGGALVDTQGQLLGINTAIYSRSGGNMGIGFAIPASTAQTVMDALLKEGAVTRGYIGVEPRELDPELREVFGLKADRGVVITGLVQNGPAAQAGVKTGDVVLRVGEVAVDNVPQMLAAVAALKPGVAAQFELQRKAETIKLSITPATRPKQPQRRR
jgi:serine protease DegQ